MPSKKKLTLDDLRVESFITKNINGGVRESENTTNSFEEEACTDTHEKPKCT